VGTDNADSVSRSVESVSGFHFQLDIHNLRYQC